MVAFVPPMTFASGRLVSMRTVFPERAGGAVDFAFFSFESFFAKRQRGHVVLVELPIAGEGPVERAGELRVAEGRERKRGEQLGGERLPLGPRGGQPLVVAGETTDVRAPRRLEIGGRVSSTIQSQARALQRERPHRAHPFVGKLEDDRLEYANRPADPTKVPCGATSARVLLPFCT